MQLIELKSKLEKIFATSFSFNEKQTQAITEAIFATVIMEIMVLINEQSDAETVKRVKRLSESTQSQEEVLKVLSELLEQVHIQKRVEAYILNSLPELIMDIVSQGLKTLPQSKRDEIIPQITSILAE